MAGRIKRSSHARPPRQPGIHAALPIPECRRTQLPAR